MDGGSDIAVVRLDSARVDEWAKAAQAGAQLCYWVGFTLKGFDDEARERMHLLQGQGFLYFKQRRHDDRSRGFWYFAERSSRPWGKPLKVVR